MVSKKINKNIKARQPGESSGNSFFVVGIGSSAGGLEALSRLLSSLPASTGMAFVIVQHLDSVHKSALSGLLSKKTSMSVREITNMVRIEPNNIYIIPPGKDITVVKGSLKLTDRKNEIPYHPIDTFLESLAHSYQENSIGIILSGTATDGTEGFEKIKAVGGITIVQDETAQYPEMPQSARSAGVVDLVLPPEEIARELVRLSAGGLARITGYELEQGGDEVNKILSILHRGIGVDFTGYKQSTIRRRIFRRANLGSFKNLEEYANYLTKNADAIDELYSDLLINVTSFFREPSICNTLAQKILPALLKNRDPSDPVRVWVPGCSSGEEAYSLAILLFEALGGKSHVPVQIFGTDLSARNIERARKGIYSSISISRLTEKRRSLFFTKADGNYQIAKHIRDMCVFAVHNFLNEPPFSKLDIVSCQNTLIYFDQRLQKKALAMFHFGLKIGGILVLGKSESMGNSRGLFDQPYKERKIYVKKQSTFHPHMDFVADSSSPRMLLTSKKPEDNKVDVDAKKEVDAILLSRYTPASVVINSDMEILQFRGDTARYLRPADGFASLNLIKMIRGELEFELRDAIRKAKNEKRTVRKEGLQIITDGATHIIGIEVIPLKAKSGNSTFLILFRDMPVRSDTAERSLPKGTRKQISQNTRLEHDLDGAREQIKELREEYETANEELQTSHEESLSSNEELQSINEELGTSQEELQASNEELRTVNDELRSKNEDLQKAHDYAEAVAITIREPLIILTQDLRVKTANAAFYRHFRVNPHETEGHFLYTLGNYQWDIPILRDLLKKIIQDNTVIDDFEVTHVFPSIGERVLLLNARRVVQKRSNESLIFLAFQDITERKKVAVEQERINMEIAQSARTKDDFLAMLSHELRNPLSPIVSALDLLSVDETRPEAVELIEIAKRQILVMTRLLDDLLDISRITKGKVSLNKNPESLGRIISNAVETARPLMDQCRHQLRVSLPEEEIVVEADAVRLEQVFINLLNNAAKYTEDGGHISIDARREDNRVVIRVQDNGIGISREILPRIFDLFTQADTSLAHTKGGLGIGLKVVKSIVELHGGNVSAKSEGVGLGSEFTVYLPILRGTAPKTGDRNAHNSDKVHKFIKKKILIVEDNRDAADTLAKLLEKIGHELHVVYDGKSALEAVSLYKPDAVLLDIGLPGIDGYEVARLIRKRGSKIRIVAITGYGTETDRQRSEQSGIDFHLIKPVGIGDLQRVLED